MDIDMGALRALEREREISMEVLLEAIESALLAAYQHTPHPAREARVEIDSKTGVVTVIARDVDVDGEVEEWDDTPEGFGRVAASIARQVIFQRIRALEDEAVLGEFAGRADDIVSGVIQQGRDSRMVQVDLGNVEGLLPPHEQVPGESYPHGKRIRAYVVDARRGRRDPRLRFRAPTRTSCAAFSSLKFPRSPTVPWRLSRSRASRGTARKWRFARTSLGSMRRERASVLWVRACARS